MTNGKKWACGAPGCEKPLEWHARRAEHLLQTEGPDAEREFEMDHPDSEEDAEEAPPVHTIRGRPIGPDNPGEYGRTHDMDCPGCAGTDFLVSPRSETYWSS